MYIYYHQNPNSCVRNIRQNKLFITRESPNCVIGSMGNFFSDINSDFDASFCFFLLKKMLLTYNKEGIKICDIHLSHHIAESYFDFAEQFKLKSTFIKSKNHNLKKLVTEKGVPFIFEVYSKNLKYHPLYKINRWDFTHFLIILDVDGNDAFISDCYIPKTDGAEIYEGKASLKNLQKAWKQNYYWYYDCPDIVPFIMEYHIDNDLCRKIFVENIQLFLTESVCAQKKFAEDFASYLLNYSIRDIKKGLNNLSIQIQTLGLMASRTYLKEFMKDHLGFTNSEVFSFIEKDIYEWHKICISIYKAALVCTKENFESIKKMILGITDEEICMFSKILDEINQN